MKIILDMNNINTKDELHNYIQKVFKFEDYYNNLDCLFDELTCITTDLTIEIINIDYIKKSLGCYTQSFIELLNKVSNTINNIKINY